MAKTTKMVEVPVSALKPYANNAKKHGRDQLEKLKASIQEFGFLTPCVIDSNYNLIAGHGRVMAAQEMGIKAVPCVFVEGLSEEQRRAYIIADNRLGELGEWDMGMVNIELADLADLDFDITLTGFELPEMGDWFDNRQRNDTSRQDGNDEYNEFLDKFEQKKTTDDCYTPDVVYHELAKWVSERYGISEDRFVRPFYPGGDYQKEAYEDGCVVVDNPPFSILSEILKWYVDRNVKFFLFAPALTLFSGRGLDICYMPAGVVITYENGAKVNTAFITNLEPGYRIRTTPDLYRILTAADKANQKANKEELPNYEYPPELVTAAMLSRYSVHGVSFDLRSDECARVSDLDAMKDAGKAIFGGGFLISEEATERNIEATRQKNENARRAEEERMKKISEEAGNMVNDEGRIVWQLSEREREIVQSLGHQE